MPVNDTSRQIRCERCIVVLLIKSDYIKDNWSAYGLLKVENYEHATDCGEVKLNDSFQADRICMALIRPHVSNNIADTRKRIHKMSYFDHSLEESALNLNRLHVLIIPAK